MDGIKILRCEAVDAGRSLIQHTLIDTIGTPQFEPQLAFLLRESVEADLARVYRLSEDEILPAFDEESPVATDMAEDSWLDHPEILRAMAAGAPSQPLLIRIDPSRIDDLHLKDRLLRRARVADMLMIWGECRGERFGFTVTRPIKRGMFGERELGNLSTLSAPLIALVAKHVQVVDRMRAPFLALKSLEQIEQILSLADVRLPRRELEVCSHILYGISIAGIAMSLGISEESVVTYRKRAFQRLSIGSRHELLLWYLSVASMHRLEFGRQPAVALRERRARA